MTQTITDNFEHISREAAKEVHMQAMTLIATKLASEEQLSMADAVKVAEFTAKRTGVMNQEKADNLPTIHWTINNGTVTMDITPAAVETEAVEVVEEVPTEQGSATSDEKAPFTLSIGDMQPLSLDAL
jgi:hypothetical protein